MKLPSLWKMMPGKRRGMGTTAKMLLVALPVAAFFAGKMWNNHMEDDDKSW